MSSLPPTGSGTSTGERTAAWKMEQPKPKPEVQKRAKRPRIDIDEQIEEANRLAALLKKVQQSAKNIKKSGQRTKKRLLAKAGRLSGEDLERISVIKRCGLIVDPHAASTQGCESEERPSLKMSKDTTRGTITGHLVRIFDGIVSAGPPAGAEGGPSSATHQQLSVPPVDKTTTMPGLLRLSSSARVGSALTVANTNTGENGAAVVVGKDVFPRDGDEVDGDLEEDIDSVAAESPEPFNP
jgi:hypothetical protein